MNPIRSAAALTGALALGLIAASPAPAQPAAAYTVTRTVALGSPDWWDYVVFDPGSHRVYVAHGDRVSVVDGQDGTVIGQVEGITGGTHGIAISAATGKGFTDDGRGGLAVPFDLKTLKTLGRIPAQPDADAMTFDPASGHVFVIDGDPGKMTVIDPTTDTVVATVNGGGKLEFAVADGAGEVYVNGEEKREIVRVNTATNMVDARWPIPNCESPHGLAIDTASHRLFSSCVNSVLTVISTDTGAVVATVPIGRGTDAAAFDPVRKLVFSSNGIDGTLSVIHEQDANTYVPTATVATARSGRTMSVDPATGRLYIAAAEVDPSPTPGARPITRPGTLKLLFLDPAK